jgi:ankyrin repeat protein
MNFETLAEKLRYGYMLKKRDLLGISLNERDSSQWTLLHYCVFSNHAEINARALLDFGFPIDEEDECGNTPLIEASIKNKINYVELLIANGANINHKNHYGETPLSSAEAWENNEVVRVLLMHGAKRMNGVDPLRGQ